MGFWQIAEATAALFLLPHFLLFVRSTELLTFTNVLEQRPNENHIIVAFYKIVDFECIHMKNYKIVESDNEYKMVLWSLHDITN